MFSMVLSLAPAFSGVKYAEAAQATTPCANLQPGDFIKVEGKPAIFGVGEGKKVRYWANGWYAMTRFEATASMSAYKAMGYKYVDQGCPESLPQPSTAPMLIPSGAGTEVLVWDEFPQWYIRLPGSIAPVSQAVAKALYGANVKPMKVSLSEWPHMAACKKGEYTDATMPHAGQVIKVGSTMYWVNYGGKLHEITTNGMMVNHLAMKYVRTWSSAVLNKFTMGDKVDSYMGMIGDVHQQGWDCNADPMMGTWMQPDGSTTTPTPGGPLTVAAAASQPSGYLASGTALNDVLKLVFTPGNMDVKVTQIKVKKQGFAATNKISGVDIIDAGGVRHGNVVSSFGADDIATILMPNDPIMLRAGVPQTVTVRVTLASTATANTLQFGLVDASYVTANGAVGGTFPIWGQTFSLQDGANSIASVTLNVQTVNATGATLNMDSTNAQEITKFRIAETSSREALQLRRLTLYNGGTAADSDFKDVQLVAQDGTVLATAQPMNKTVIFDLSATPYLIDKGQTRDLTVRAKIANGPTRTIQLSVYNDYDLELRGVSSNANVLATTLTGGSTGAGTSFPVGNDSTNNKNKVTIGNGSLSFNKDVTSPSTAVTPGATGVVLAKFFAKPNGEDMELRKVTLAITTSSAYALAGNIYIKVNGNVVYSGAASAISVSSGAPTTVTLNTYPTLTNLQNNYITVEGDINQSATGSDSYKVYLDLYEVRRIGTNGNNGSNDIIDPSVAQSSGNTLNVQATQLTLTNTTLPVAQSTVVGASKFALSRIELNASGSGEDVRVTSITFADYKSASTTYTDISNLSLYQITDTGEVLLNTSNSTAVNDATVAFSLSNALTVTRAKTIQLVLRGDIVARNGSVTSTHRFVATSTVASGSSTGNSITATINGSSGQVMTIVTGGTTTISLVSGAGATPDNIGVVAAETKDKVVFAFKISAQQEATRVSTLTLTATGTALSATSLTNLRLYWNNSATPFATKDQMTCTSNTCTMNWTSSYNVLPEEVQPGIPATVTVKADIGNKGNVVLKDNFVFSIASTSTDFGAVGVSSAASSTVGGTAVANKATFITDGSVVITGETPAANTTFSTVVTASNTPLASFRVTNNTGHKISLSSVTFSSLGSTSNTLTYRLYYSDESGTVATTDSGATASGSFGFGNLTTPIEITGNRLLTIKVAGGTPVVGDTFSAAVAALGNVTYSVTESDLGYNANPSATDSDMDDTISTLYVDGKPVLGAVRYSAS